ncbi:MAG: A24 family peptidase [Planctomycetota bacterium]
MAWLLEVWLPLRLAALFVVSAGVASLLNAAVYAWAWERRLVSPWQPAAAGASPRTRLDRIPIVGWLRLRRDAPVLGRGFWVRPMLIEAGFAAGIAALYWWEVDQLGLIRPQLADLAQRIAAPLPTVDPASIAGPLHAQFFAHAVLAALMTIATFIDFDDRIIPDEVTFPGTLAGLLLAATLPLCLLPSVQERFAPPAAGVVVEAPGGAALTGPDGGALYLVPTHVAAPNAWPAALAGKPSRASLLLGLGCFWLWCFAIADRRWPGRGPALKRFGEKLRLQLARLHRSLTTRPIREALLAGTLLIAMVWYGGGPSWVALLTALVGLVVSGGLVWAVRIIGTAAMGREAMGFGDVTLMMMVGTLTGWQAAPLIFFLAPAAGLVLAVFNLLLRGDHAIPYGPFLCLATVVVIAGWGHLWVWAELLYAVGWLVPGVLVVCFVLMGVLLGMLRGLKALLGVAGEDY